ncbi:MAG: acyl-CoA dehydrogenase family protein [Thermoleophilia bacterium]
MTAVDTAVTTPRGVLDAAGRLAPSISGRAGEIEAGRRVPRDLLDDLVAAGVFRMLRPTTHGGAEADLPGAMRLFETLARADASVAWTAMIGSASWCDLVSLPRATFDELFAVPDTITAGVFAPAGTAGAAGGGYRVSGRWGFASGCEHADWIFGNCVEGVDDGRPRLRIAVFAPGQVEIEDTWTVSGLCGTGSHHFHVDAAVVPAERTLDPMAHVPCLDTPIVRVPIASLIALSIASVAVGCAQGALDEVAAVAADKVPLLASGHLAGSPTFQLELAAADAELRAARALIYEMAEEAWEIASDGEEPSLHGRARTRAGTVWATERAAEVVRTAFRAGGGASIYAASPLQRRLRDTDAITQHFIMRRDTLVTAGAIPAGQEVQITVF